MHKRIFSVINDKSGEKIPVKLEDLPETIIYPGMPVSYQLVETSKGCTAVSVRLI